MPLQIQPIRQQGVINYFLCSGMGGSRCGEEEGYWNRLLDHARCDLWQLFTQRFNPSTQNNFPENLNLHNTAMRISVFAAIYTYHRLQEIKKYSGIRSSCSVHVPVKYWSNKPFSSKFNQAI